MAIAVDAATFFVSALFIGAMTLPASLRLEIPSFFGELGDGWREFSSRTWLWVIVVQFSIVNACEAGSLNVLGPVQADAYFGRLWWGGILACFAAGLIAGGVTMLRFRPPRMLLVATFGVLLMAPTLVLLAVPAQAAVIALSAFVTGVGIELFAVLWDTTMQQQIPEEKLSRVYSYDMLGSIALVPVGRDRADRRCLRHGGHARRERGLHHARDPAGIRGARRQGAAKEVTARVFSSRSSR